MNGTQGLCVVASASTAAMSPGDVWLYGAGIRGVACSNVVVYVSHLAYMNSYGSKLWHDTEKQKVVSVCV